MLEEPTSSFLNRHIGPRSHDIDLMLRTLGLSSMDELIHEAVPQGIRLTKLLQLPAPLNEPQALEAAQALAKRNLLFRSFIGQGYYGSVTPAVIQRNIMEDPGWYTQYTPYQAEISQGRLEALLNYQTLVSDLTGLELANASLLDEGTAAAEGLALAYSARSGPERRRFFVADDCHPQTVAVVQTRAQGIGVETVVGDPVVFEPDRSFFGALVQYPATDGKITEYTNLCREVREAGGLFIVSTDLLSLTLLDPPGDWGSDVAVGNSQRFGVPMGFGGPHAGFFATRDEFKRLIPGRIVGVSKDRFGRPALRLAMQTREQHIRRERATSNICTAQVLLAIMASMYAVYHGPRGLRRIARRIHNQTVNLADRLQSLGLVLRHELFFDTLRLEEADLEVVQRRALEKQINLRYYADRSMGLSLDETTDDDDLKDLCYVLSGKNENWTLEALPVRIPESLRRRSDYLEHPVFNRYHSETELLRYVQRLRGRDLSLTTSMIPLGSCTMKLNAASEMIPISWPEWNALHPFCPDDQTLGYQSLIRDLETMLCEITGMEAVSLQPNSGAQGEYAGLLTISAYQHARGEDRRKVCLIPQSAHGTNPASAVMAGMKVVPVRCQTNGDIDIEHLEILAQENSQQLAALMVTYPSTHGVFEESIRDICDIVHQHGGQIYMDGANMNALVGLCRPGEFGVDVCHLNLHKTFCIPHGGGGPGVGPIAVQSHLVKYLPGHAQLMDGERRGGAVASAPWGSASILPIPWVYLRLTGAEGLRRATEVAVLNANYVAARLESYYPVLYRGRNGRVAHECILDCRHFKRSVGITVADIAKRLIDYGFHAPTVSWPVVETLMVEPTESESREELDRFCEAMISIRREIEEVELGLADRENNVLKNAPHTAEEIAADDWPHPYSRQKAAFPVPSLIENKFWTICGRVDDTYGDRHLFCSCVPVKGFAEVVD